ncbi:hypothetical protein DCCM_2419 [Desulfocucumis palustris]|uniref:Uncharacterized protein n=1 Tax=Desulfocucumis palustris TaxID=1898651 RepID=A0A2L2XB48_9FIRM|nr:hypothetical protein DCCM_2419 [Desulfocucumis palustris]
MCHQQQIITGRRPAKHIKKFISAGGLSAAQHYQIDGPDNKILLRAGLYPIRIWKPPPRVPANGQNNWV